MNKHLRINENVTREKKQNNQVDRTNYKATNKTGNNTDVCWSIEKSLCEWRVN